MYMYKYLYVYIHTHTYSLSLVRKNVVDFLNSNNLINPSQWVLGLADLQLLNYFWLNQNLLMYLIKEHVLMLYIQI